MTTLHTPQARINAAANRADRAALTRRLQHLCLAAALATLTLALGHAALTTARNLPETMARAAAESVW